MDRAHSRTVPVEVVGAHFGDDALRLVRVRTTADGRSRATAVATLDLPDGLVERGLVRAAGVLPPAVARAAGSFAAGTPIRVALTTADCAVVPLGASESDPLALLAAHAASSGPATDVVWADVVSIGQRSVGLAGARRSSVQRTAGALRRADLAVAAVEAGPVCLVATAMSLGASPTATWTVELRGGDVEMRTTVSRGGRVEGAAAPTASGAAAFLLTTGPTPRRPIDLFGQLLERLGRAATRRATEGSTLFALAYGATLVGRWSAVVSPDLARAVVVRPLGTSDPELPRWAVEPLAAPSCGDRPIRSRRVGRLAARAPS